jgi:hypothetical protein
VGRANVILAKAKETMAKARVIMEEEKEKAKKEGDHHPDHLPQAEALPPLSSHLMEPDPSADHLAGHVKKLADHTTMTSSNVIGPSRSITTATKTNLVAKDHQMILMNIKENQKFMRPRPSPTGLAPQHPPWCCREAVTGVGEPL